MYKGNSWKGGTYQVIGTFSTIVPKEVTVPYKKSTYIFTSTYILGGNRRKDVSTNAYNVISVLRSRP
jgi:hypothetical protein